MVQISRTLSTIGEAEEDVQALI
eukprot:COSAG05_NODE_21822_length_269_cov_0.605882_1_plen_22_part_10